MGKWLLTDYSATLGRIFRVIFWQPNETSIPVKCWKISPLAPQRMRARISRIRRIADYGQLWHFLLWGHQLAMFRDQSAMLEEHLSQKLMRDHAYNPKIWPKMWQGGSTKRPKLLMAIFVKRPINPRGKIFQTQKTYYQNLFSSWSYRSFKFEFVGSQISSL